MSNSLAAFSAPPPPSPKGFFPHCEEMLVLKETHESGLDRTTAEEVLLGQDHERNNMVAGNEMKRKYREKETLKLLV